MKIKNWVRSLLPEYGNTKDGDYIKYKSAKGINGNPDFLIDGIINYDKEVEMYLCNPLSPVINGKVFMRLVKIEVN